MDSAGFAGYTESLHVEQVVYMKEGLFAETVFIKNANQTS